LRARGRRTRRADRGRARLVGPQTIPQEFVALFHGLLALTRYLPSIGHAAACKLGRGGRQAGGDAFGRRLSTPVGESGPDAARSVHDHSKLVKLVVPSSGWVESALGSGKHQQKTPMSATLPTARCSEFTPSPAGG
jgi:hypothetical protein